MDPRFDASGNIIEHYSDGDLVNEDTPYGREQRQKTVDTLEKIGRQSIADDEKKRKEEKVELRDTVTRDSIKWALDHPKEPDADKQNLVAVRRDLVFCMNLLGLFGDAPADAIKRIEQKQRDVRNIDAAAIEAELARRNEARASKDFARADAIRKQLAERGVEILDRPNNTSEWRLK